MSKIKKTKEDYIYEYINTFFLIIIFIVVAYPLIYIISASFSSPRAVLGGKVWFLPVEPSLLGYETILAYNRIWIGYKNTIYYTVFGTLVNVIMTILAAYPLSRKDFGGRGFIMFAFAFTMLFSGGLIPGYILVSSLGLIDSRWVMILPRAVAVWNIIITRTFFQATIPDELLEASQLDGCSNTKFLIKVVLPLSGAITAVNVLFYAVGYWNSFFDAFIYLNSPDLFPLQIILRQILIVNTPDIQNQLLVRADDLAIRQGLKELLKYSLIIVSSLPVLVLYPFVQKYFVKGVMIGSIKG